LLAVALLTGGIVACGSGDDGGSEGSAPIVGAGSTAQEVAQENWIEELELEEPGAEVSYEPVGSGQGRRRFVAGEVAYAATDTPLEGPELQQAVERCEPGQLVEIPAYLSKVTVAVHVGNGFVYLTPETMARVFNGEITRWDAPEIRRENSPIAKQLRGPIKILYPAGDLGTTAIFTAYLSEVVSKAWGRGPSETWPVPGVGTAVGSPAALVKAIKARKGALSYVDASISGRLKPVLIKTGSEVGDVAVPNRGSSIGLLESSPEAKDLKESPYMMPFDLERSYGERGTYPIVFTSYLLACTAYDSEEEATAVRRFLSYAVSLKGQEVASLEAGADPLLGKLQKRAEAAAQAIE
jgi:phosphate transport system substrate-binding protein